jgi:hypothetical protein
MSHDEKELADYLGALRAASDLLKPPSIEPPIFEEPEWHWSGVAETPVDQGLEKWTWGLTRFGHVVVVRAALAMLDEMLPVWDAAVQRGSPGIKTSLENIERDFDPSPRKLRDDIQSWLADPTDERLDALCDAIQGDRLDLFDAIGNDEFKAIWNDDPWMFVLTGAYAAAMSVYEDEGNLPRAIGNVAVSCRLALAPTAKAAAGIQTWRAAAGALTAHG